MIAPPSLQSRFTWIWSDDPALARPPADADESVLKTFEKRLEVARETGKWGDVVRDGESPTLFSVRPLSGSLLRRISDETSQGKYHHAQAFSLVVRLCLRAVQNPDLPVEIENSTYGERTTVDIVDTLDAINPSIVTEMGAYLYRRASAPPGK